ncbi:hypothetical protein BUALT_Bualt09G0132200 [Buddleja alternifolia]|uniref:Solute carrier family 40 member n=1 Tax=Buddleja alternifolia TaxID=168488 RepID=A0AAV6X6H3_9LAMI|nr:hypothetical protein BUALT_Bualt09G0132200 [Buddleja alternifolia]
MMHDQPLLCTEEQQPLSFPSSLLVYLYVGHFLARWCARFNIHYLLHSLLLAATYGVVESSSTALFGPFIGHWVDKLSYIQVLRLWLLSQNMSFMVAGGSVVVVLVYTELMTTNYAMFILLVILINISGAVGVLSTLAGTILVEREWVIVISEGQPPGVLTRMNSVIRRIDLICKLCAPVISGFIISFVSLTASAVTLALWNLLSVCLQYWLLMSVYNGIPALQEISQRRISRSSVRETDEITSTHNEGKKLTFNDLEQPESSSKRTLIHQFLNLPYISAWRLYIQQDVVLPGLALALLYFTVLSFGTLMTAALEWKGIPAYVIGIARGISATFGIAATFLYPVLESHISTLRTGLWSIWSQDHVPESDRCVVGGVQNSLQSVLDLMTYIMGIIISNPQDFWKLTILSFLLVTLAAALYSLYIYRVRKHLFHFEKLLLRWPLGSS